MAGVSERGTGALQVAADEGAASAAASAPTTRKRTRAADISNLLFECGVNRADEVGGGPIGGYHRRYAGEERLPSGARRRVQGLLRTACARLCGCAGAG